MKFYLTVTNDKLTADSPIKGYTGNKNTYTLNFAFSEEWEEMTFKFCSIISGKNKFAVPIADNEITLPYALMEKASIITVGVYGEAPDAQKRISTNFLPLRLYEGAYQPGATEPEIPKPDFWETLVLNAVPKIGDNGNWWIYSITEQKYVDTGLPSIGSADLLPYYTMEQTDEIINSKIIPQIEQAQQTADAATELNKNKVDKDGDKVLSDNNYTYTDKGKVDGLLYFYPVLDTDGWEQFDTIQCGFGAFTVDSHEWTVGTSKAESSGDFKNGEDNNIYPITPNASTVWSRIFVIITNSYQTTSAPSQTQSITTNNVTQIFFDGACWYKRTVEKITTTDFGNDNTIEWNLDDNGGITETASSTESTSTTIWSYTPLVRIDTDGKELTENKVTEISGEPSDEKYPSEKAVVDYVSEKIADFDNMGGGTTIITSITDDTLILELNQEARLGKLSGLILSLPDEIDDLYESSFSFTCGENGTELTCTDGIIWRGDDVNSQGVFTPVAGTMYEVSVKLVGYDVSDNSVIVARVGAI